MGRDAAAEGIVFTATDGYPLTGRIWQPNAATASVAVLINSGAGISSSYYDRFAEFIASHGAAVLTYDYRGIGKSRPRSLNGFSASVEVWGRNDCAAALNLLADRFAPLPIVVLGHSVGGFVTGFVQNGHLIDRLIFIGAHTGYWGDYARNSRFQMYVLWHLIMPGVTRMVGFFPGRALRLCEDIPMGVAMEWANRRQPDFWWNLRTETGDVDADRIDELLSRFRKIQAPTVAIRISDDPFATPDATDRILRLFSNCQSTQLVLGPANVAGQPIGHFGFFRSRFRDALWPLVATKIVL
jgi:predicted alpha/beta hydrolase